MPRFTVVTTTTVQAADLADALAQIVGDYAPGTVGSPWVLSCPPVYDEEGAYVSFAPTRNGYGSPVSFFVRTNR